MKQNEILDPIKQLASGIDMKQVNKLLKETSLKDFEMQKQTIENIAEWCLNGNSDTEIRKKLALTENQWLVLVACCPTLLVIISQSRQLAEVVLAGSLYQTAIGGKIVRKQQLARVHKYDDNGKVIGERIEKVWVEEELPPNPLLLKFLAEKKLDEKLGENSNKEKDNFKDIIDNVSKEDLALLKAMNKVDKTDDN